MPTVGNFADFNKIEDARARAADLARVIVETGLNPNELARKEAKSSTPCAKSSPATATTWLRVLNALLDQKRFAS